MKTDWKVGEEMKRIGTRIVLAVLFCSIIMSLLLGGFSTIRIISVIRKESKENLLQLTRVYGKTLDELLVSYEELDSKEYGILDAKYDGEKRL